MVKVYYCTKCNKVIINKELHIKEIHSEMDKYEALNLIESNKDLDKQEKLFENG